MYINDIVDVLPKDIVTVKCQSNFSSQANEHACFLAYYDVVTTVNMHKLEEMLQTHLQWESAQNAPTMLNQM